MTDDQIIKIAQGFNQRKTLAEVEAEVVSYKFDALGFARAILAAAPVAAQEPIAAKLDELAAMHEATRLAATNPNLERIHLGMREAYQHAASIARTALPAPGERQPDDARKAIVYKCSYDRALERLVIARRLMSQEQRATLDVEWRAWVAANPVNA